MIALDEDALICDFAEYYHIYDMYALNVEYAAILANGLRDNSRIRTKASGLKVEFDTLLLAKIADSTAINAYLHTQDAADGINQPALITPALLGVEQEKDTDELESFDTGNDFMREWEKIHNGNGIR